jgi:hypothetical protein
LEKGRVCGKDRAIGWQKEIGGFNLESNYYMDQLKDQKLY